MKSLKQDALYSYLLIIGEGVFRHTWIEGTVLIPPFCAALNPLIKAYTN
jgi:hypothetical protein